MCSDHSGEFIASACRATTPDQAAIRVWNAKVGSLNPVNYAPNSLTHSHLVSEEMEGRMQTAKSHTNRDTASVLSVRYLFAVVLSRSRLLCFQKKRSR